MSQKAPFVGNSRAIGDKWQRTGSPEHGNQSAAGLLQRVPGSANWRDLSFLFEELLMATTTRKTAVAKKTVGRKPATRGSKAAADSVTRRATTARAAATTSRAAADPAA